ncbi:MAG: N-6 DNA methylase, partial [Actinomycetota bacterium]|nr:N-6 DNA methylase [Actinomycetota bacterium]
KHGLAQSSFPPRLDKTTMEKLDEIYDFNLATGCVRDFLGDAYMRLGIGNGKNGQYFTPENVSDMMAAMMIPEFKLVPSTNHIFKEKGCSEKICPEWDEAVVEARKLVKSQDEIPIIIEVASEENGQRIKGIYRALPAPKSLGQFFARQQLLAIHKEPAFLKTVLDPCVGSGRLLISAFKKLGYMGLYYGCEIDPMVYQMCLLNIYYFQIPAHVLRADALMHDLRPNSPNWKYANLWDGPPWEKLTREKPSPEIKKMVEEKRTGQLDLFGERRAS